MSDWINAEVRILEAEYKHTSTRKFPMKIWNKESQKNEEYEGDYLNLKCCIIHTFEFDKEGNRVPAGRFGETCWYELPLQVNDKSVDDMLGLIACKTEDSVKYNGLSLTGFGIAEGPYDTAIRPYLSKTSGKEYLNVLPFRAHLSNKPSTQEDMAAHKIKPTLKSKFAAIASKIGQAAPAKEKKEPLTVAAAKEATSAPEIKSEDIPW